jgi:histidine phosphotransferase ChpT
MAVTSPAHKLAESDAPAVSAAEVATRLAQRLIHDFMSPASGIVSGLDLLEDPTAQELREEAMELVGASARKLVQALTFARAAFGAGAEPYASTELESLAQGVFAHLRPQLEWAVEAPALSPLAGRTLLNLVQLAAGALAVGGVAKVTARIEPPWTAIMVDAVGERARLHAEVAAGLRGEAMGEGLSGRWVQAFCLHELVTSAGGVVAAEAADGRVEFKGALPA